MKLGEGLTVTGRINSYGGSVSGHDTAGIFIPDGGWSNHGGGTGTSVHFERGTVMDWTQEDEPTLMHREVAIEGTVIGCLYNDREDPKKLTHVALRFPQTLTEHLHDRQQIAWVHVDSLAPSPLLKEGDAPR